MKKIFKIPLNLKEKLLDFLQLAPKTPNNGKLGDEKLNEVNYKNNFKKKCLLILMQYFIFSENQCGHEDEMSTIRNYGYPICFNKGGRRR